MKLILLLLATSMLWLTDYALSEELTADELARAQGISWWSIALPEGKEGDTIGFTIEFADGTVQRSGATSFRPGSRIKAFCAPAEDPAWLKVSLISESGTIMLTKMKNPFGVGVLVIHPLNNGDQAKLGQFLIKGTSSGTEGVSDENSLKANEFAIYVQIRE